MVAVRTSATLLRMSTGPLPTLPLRERKRLRAMRNIQSVALELFDREGFDTVTVERIAELAEVSPSSIYRWFGTKEQLIIWDEYDPASLVAFQERLADTEPLEALREVVSLTMGAAFDDDAERIKLRLRLAFTNPSVEAASILQTHEMAQLIAGIIASYRDSDPSDLDIQVAAHGFVGALLGALRHWYASDFTTPIEDIIERPLAVIEQGAGLP